MINYYSIYDKVAKEFAPFFPAKTDELAVRMVLNSLKEQIRKKVPIYPDDIVLYRVLSANLDSDKDFDLAKSFESINIDFSNVNED